MQGDPGQSALKITSLIITTYLLSVPLDSKRMEWNDPLFHSMDRLQRSVRSIGPWNGSME